jgi:hypothetical protein
LIIKAKESHSIPSESDHKLLWKLIKKSSECFNVILNSH